MKSPTPTQEFFYYSHKICYAVGTGISTNQRWFNEYGILCYNVFGISWQDNCFI